MVNDVLTTALPFAPMPLLHTASPSKIPARATVKSKMPKRLAVVVLLVLTVAAGGYIFNQLYVPNSSSVVAFNATRNYEQTPFDELDAQQICQFQTQDQYRGQLLLTYLDTHSSRYEPSLGIFKIFLVAHIGERGNYEEANIHCYINPQDHLIEHYKAIFPQKSSLMSRALSFFTH